jgi:ADP-heptose:LPS heptosyltransferase
VRLLIFKPDGIGDFVLATGALRLLAREVGEENLTLCVQTILGPLARDQFPRATVWELPTAAERRVLNLFVWNLWVCRSVWWRLVRARFDAAICLRSMRNYLETLLFYSARSPRHIACENILLRAGRRVRRAVEGTVRRLARPELLPYPETPGGLPLEVEANRLVVERALGRPVAADEVVPNLRAPGNPAGGYWVWAPVTNLASKVYPAARWAEAFAGLRAEVGTRPIRLVGVAADVPRLTEYRDALHAAGLTGSVIDLPPDLAAFVRVLAGADLVLSVDTAAAHFATALDRPTVVVFSGLHLGMFGPWTRSARQHWILPDPPEASKKRKWTARLSPGRIADAARKALTAHETCS